MKMSGGVFIFQGVRVNPGPEAARVDSLSAAPEVARSQFSNSVMEASFSLPLGKRAQLGEITQGIELVRGRIEPSYPRSNGEPLGEMIPVMGARGGICATLEVAKLQSGAIIHNLTIELPGNRKGSEGRADQANSRTVSLVFPSEAVAEPAVAFQRRVAIESGPAPTHEFNLRHLSDSSGQALAHNLLNVVESSAVRWRSIFPKGQRLDDLQVAVERISPDADKLTFTIITQGRTGQQAKELSFVFTEDRLFTVAEHAALQEIYSALPEGISKEYFQWFREQQFYAWLWRKYLEPGGSSHPGTSALAALDTQGLDSVFSSANGLASQDERGFLFASRLSTHIIQNFSALGADAIEKMRAAGEKLLVCGVALDRGEFTAQNLLHGVPCLGSDPAKIDPALVLAGANLHHEGWMETMRWMNSRGVPEMQMPARREQQAYDPRVINDYWIRDCGNFYGLSFLVGSMSEAALVVLKQNCADTPAPAISADLASIEQLPRTT